MIYFYRGFWSFIRLVFLLNSFISKKFLESPSATFMVKSLRRSVFVFRRSMVPCTAVGECVYIHDICESSMDFNQTFELGFCWRYRWRVIKYSVAPERQSGSTTDTLSAASLCMGIGLLNTEQLQLVLNGPTHTWWWVFVVIHSGGSILSILVERDASVLLTTMVKLEVCYFKTTTRWVRLRRGASDAVSYREAPPFCMCFAVLTVPSPTKLDP